jgi:hypothetical protein
MKFPAPPSEILQKEHTHKLTTRNLQLNYGEPQAGVLPVMTEQPPLLRHQPVFVAPDES